MQNFVDRSLFKTRGASTDELTRRLDMLASQIYMTLESIKSDLSTLSSANGDKYSGTVYAVDTEGNTVSLLVESGVVKSVSRT